MGWNGSYRTWHRYETVYLLLAGIATPLVVSVHSIVSSDFATAVLPGWHATIFPPYFVAGTIFSGMAMVLILRGLGRRPRKPQRTQRKANVFFSLCPLCPLWFYSSLLRLRRRCLRLVRRRRAQLLNRLPEDQALGRRLGSWAGRCVHSRTSPECRGNAARDAPVGVVEATQGFHRSSEGGAFTTIGTHGPGQADGAIQSVNLCQFDRR